MGVKSSVMLKEGLIDPGEFTSLVRGVSSRPRSAPVAFSENEHVSSLAVNFSFEVCLLSTAPFVALCLLQGGQVLPSWGLRATSSVKAARGLGGGGLGARDMGEGENILWVVDWGEMEAWDKAGGES